MCKSLAEGGQRCASHTRTKMVKAAAAVEAAAAARDVDALGSAQAQWEEAAVEYASTNEGHDHLAAQAQAALAAGDYDTHALLNTVVQRGEAMRAANRETAALLAAVRLSQTEPDPAALPALSDRAVAPAAPAPAAGTAPVLSVKDRQRWVEALADLRTACEGIDSFPVRASATPVTPEQVIAAFEDFDAVLADPTADDADLIRAVAAYREAKGSLGRTPTTKTEAVKHRDIDNGLYHDPPNKKALQRWREWVSAHYVDVDKPQFARLLAHPGAGERTYRHLLAGEPGLTRAATGCSNCPLPVLNEAIRVDHTERPDSDMAVHPDGWARARDARMGPGGAAIALSLAAKDPDAWQRQEAVNHVMVTPMDDFTADDRAWLVAHLHEIPGDANQQALARSVADWAKAYADDAERQRLRNLFTEDQINAPRYLSNGWSSPAEANQLAPALRGIGAAIPTRQAAVAEEPKKRGWFGRD